MEKYTIYCTEEQTKKAIKLGAPIHIISTFESTLNPRYIQLDLSCVAAQPQYTYMRLPTAEQMLGWLEDQGFYIRLSSTSGSVEMDCKCIYERGGTNHKIAALAVIDAALEYLSNNQKK